MYCNQIFSILKKVEPVPETPAEETPGEVIEETIQEETTPDETAGEEQTETTEEPAEETPEEPTEEPVEEPVEEEAQTEEPVGEEPTETEEPTEEPVEEEEPETDQEATEEGGPIYVVANIIVCPTYEIASRIARCEFGESALAIDTTLYPVAIGDIYRDGVFYDSLGNVIERNLTEQEQIAALRQANADQAAVIEDLNTQLLMVQLAAAELYEQSRAAEEPATEATENLEEVTEEPAESTEPEAAGSEVE